MSDIQIGLLAIAGILLLIYSGMYVAIVLALLSFLGVGLIRDSFAVAGKLLALTAGDSISNYAFGVVPLFVLMGMFISVSDIGQDMFQVADRIFRRIKGGMGVATVAANAVFAAVTGISIASAAVFTKVAVPEMIKLGYKPRFTVGVVAGSSVLGMLIPPSLLLILFGVLTESSIGDLFKAAIFPGILLAAAYIVYILILAYMCPDHVVDPNYRPQSIDQKRMTIWAAIWKLSPIVVLVFLVLGGIYSGWFTPTESGAVGALGALLLALCKRRMSWRKLWDVLVETGYVTVSILFLIISANMFARMLAMSGLTGYLSDYVANSGLGLHGFLFIFIAVVVFMGTILDSSSILMLVVPLTLPIMQEMGINYIWFGVITVVAIEIGLITPPLGIAAYVVKSTLDDQKISLGDVFRGAFPYVIIMVVVLMLLVLFPQISLFLVN